MLQDRIVQDQLIGSDRGPRLTLEQAQAIPLAEIRKILDTVVDPEIPVLTVNDLGVLRDLAWEGATLVVTITPTYSGCPAMQTFEDDIRHCLLQRGLMNIRIQTSLSPAWTTDWLTDTAKQKLETYGIAPPKESSNSRAVLMGLDPEVKCPKCGSEYTKQISRHGSTACKALYQCDDCLEPFDYFKCI